MSHPPTDPPTARAPRRSPRLGPGGAPQAPGWRVSRVPADAPDGTPSSLVRACAPDLADARAGLRAPAPGDFAPLDLLDLSPVGGATGPAERWFVRDDGLAVPLPDPSQSLSPGLFFSPDFGRWLRLREDWREAWSLGRGDLLVGMAAAAGLDPRGVLGTAVAFLRHAMEAPRARAAGSAAAWAPIEAALDEVEAWASGGPVPVGAFGVHEDLGKVLRDADRDADCARRPEARRRRGALHAVLHLQNRAAADETDAGDDAFDDAGSLFNANAQAVPLLSRRLGDAGCCVF